MSRELADPELEARRLNALRLVRQFGDPVLRTPTGDVTEFDDALQDEIDRMERIMIDAHGVGLAAPQVGTLRRLLVYRTGDGEPTQALVNPRLVWASEEQDVEAEGCLSIGEVAVDVPRAVEIRVEARAADGADMTIEASGFEARVIQHEMDHLDGILILDRTTKDQRRDALKALREQQ
ncbi:MAG: peptide deformylase [Actinobacteria bacterium]|nr:peptide deformylase [Gemmatimonadota bacterium]MCB9010841.1 peptide deformylase [Actinomycetota bacterium]